MSGKVKFIHLSQECCFPPHKYFLNDEDFNKIHQPKKKKKNDLNFAYKSRSHNNFFKKELKISSNFFPDFFLLKFLCGP